MVSRGVAGVSQQFENPPGPDPIAHFDSHTAGFQLGIESEPSGCQLADLR